MSYILDALQRSDNERAVENIPTLHSDRRSRGRRARRLDSTWIALLAILLIVAFVAFWYRGTIMDVATRYIPSFGAAEVPPLAANAPAAAAPPPDLPAPPAPEQTPAAPRVATPRISDTVRQAIQPSSAPAVAVPAPGVPETGVQAPQPKAVPETPPATVAQAQPVASEVEDANDLPPAMRQKLPSMTLNVVSYSKNDERRFVMIDQKIFREGDSVPGGMTIEEITEDGPIMRWQGRQFLMRP